MIESLIEIDSSLFRLINSWNTPFVDEVMYLFSHRFVWIPLYVFIIYLIIKQYKLASIAIIFALIVTLFFTDQLSVLIKDLTMRLRPSHNPAFENIIHLNKGIKGGMYGFVSSHAANVAGFVSFLFFIGFLKNKYLFLLLLLWAFLVSYSRVYNGLHYPADIIGGWILGIFVAFCLSFALKTLYLKKLSNKLKI